jgi:WD40 repeat protein
METMVQVASVEPVPPSRLQPKLPTDLETVCLKCLEKSASRRYATAQALADDLRRFLAGEPIQARPAGRLERCVKWSRRRPTAAALVAVSALALLAMFAGGLYFTIQLGRERNTALAEKARADVQRKLAEDNEADARRQEEKAREQEKLTDTERRRAEEREADARRELDLSRRSLLTAQLWRVAGLLEHEPMEALALLEDRNACPDDLRDFPWRYYRGLFQQWKPAVLVGFRGKFSSVAVSPDGKTLALGEGEEESGPSGGRGSGIIKLWNLETRKETAELRGHKGDVFIVAFSPDGKILASAGYDHTVRLWDVDKKEEIATLKKHSGPVSGLSFSADGKWLASAGMAFDPNEKVNDLRFKKGEVHLWNVAERKHERLLHSAPDTGTMAVSFAPDGKTVALGTTNRGDMRVVDVETGKEVNKHNRNAGWIYRVAYSPDGQTVAWATAQQAIFLSEAMGKQTLHTLRGHQGDVYGLAWSPDGKTLATGSVDGVIKLWNPATGRERLTLRRGAGRINNLTFTPDGNTLVVVEINQILLWDLVPRTSWATYSATKGFRAVALSDDGQTLAAASGGERTLKLRDLRSGKERVLDLDTGSGTALAFVPNGTLLAVGVHGWKEAKNETQKTRLMTGECQLWDAGAGRKVATLKTKGGHAVTALAFTPEGRWLITGDTGGEIYLWDVTDPEKPKEAELLGKQPSRITVLALSADGRTLATGSIGPWIKLWDLAERRERTTLKGRDGSVTGLAFLDGDKSLACTSFSRSVLVWDVSAGTARFALPPQPYVIHALAVSKDGNTLALACQDRTVKLWDVPSRQLRAVLLGHTREVNAVCFSHDGNLLLSASAPNSSWFVTGGEVKVWKAGE